MPDHFSGGNVKTIAKLKILDWYLNEYVNIMDNQWWDTWYVDTHSGTGKTELDNGILVDGSAIRVLENHQSGFERFYFYEIDEEHFHLLHETLADEFGLDFEVSPIRDDEEDFLVARCDDPYIRIMQQDSNDGVSFLAENAGDDSHWFTFVDPKGLTAKKSTLDTLIERGHMDILINYQSTGVMRNASESAEHGHDAVSRTLGDDEWETDGSVEDYVEAFEERLERHEEWAPVMSKEMIDPHNSSYRFDLIFASANDTAREVMRYIMEERDDLWEKASDEMGQSGIGDFF